MEKRKSDLFSELRSKEFNLLFHGLPTAGVSNIRPAGQIQPVAWLDPARGMIL